MNRILAAMAIAVVAFAANAVGADAHARFCLKRIHHHRIVCNCGILRYHHIHHASLETLPPPPPRVRYRVRYVEVPAPQPQVVYVQAPPPPPRIVYVQAPPPPIRVVWHYRFDPPPPHMRVVWHYRFGPPPMMMQGGYGYGQHYGYGGERRMRVHYRLIRRNRYWPPGYN